MARTSKQPANGTKKYRVLVEYSVRHREYVEVDAETPEAAKEMGPHLFHKRGGGKGKPIEKTWTIGVYPVKK